MIKHWRSMIDLLYFFERLEMLLNLPATGLTEISILRLYQRSMVSRLTPITRKPNSIHRPICSQREFSLKGIKISAHKSGLSLFKRGVSQNRWTFCKSVQLFSKYSSNLSCNFYESFALLTTKVPSIADDIFLFFYQNPADDNLLNTRAKFIEYLSEHTVRVVRNERVNNVGKLGSRDPINYSPPLDPKRIIRLNLDSTGTRSSAYIGRDTYSRYPTATPRHAGFASCRAPGGIFLAPVNQRTYQCRGIIDRVGDNGERNTRQLFFDAVSLRCEFRRPRTFANATDTRKGEKGTPWLSCCFAVSYFIRRVEYWLDPRYLSFSLFSKPPTDWLYFSYAKAITETVSREFRKRNLWLNENILRENSIVLFGWRIDSKRVAFAAIIFRKQETINETRNDAETGTRLQFKLQSCIFPG